VAPEGELTMHVHNILRTKGTTVATITPDASLADATAALRDHGVGALVVSRDGATIDGIISERDLVRALAAHGASSLGRDVASAMSTHVTTCLGSDTVDDLMAMMTEQRIRHLPVVDADRTLAGIISIGDVVKARVGQLESENHQLHDYIQAR
jgi:CBS domain-containing protein